VAHKTNVTRLSIPRGTRLETVWRVVDMHGRINWHVYTACADRNAPFNKMQGTCLLLHADGGAARYTDDNDLVNYMEIMPNIEDMS